MRNNDTDYIQKKSVYEKKISILVIINFMLTFDRSKILSTGTRISKTSPSNLNVVVLQR
jgi:hypothetical protein